ncbi:hypothetical protein DQ239_04675 [Blastococcus sp. TF02-09]|uniref:phosphatase PAP2 family protein n=1 Tax=Blastococcus sp. TF02-09 TaxID=2250576 RepID=UPI000DEAA08C|nr:phosphatase PAP2 family protein [Blastococcus sp. TF02-9]RBY80351.1 hypothetical protein DQ239_04675 [Blastococcus sp. TF02-9]
MTSTAPAVRRGRAEVALLAGGLVLLGLAALPVDAARVGGGEAAVYRVLNGTDVLPFALVWPVMQLGNLLVVPATALLALALRRVRLAASLLVAGLAAYWLAKVVKGLVPRGRPAGLLEDVVIRGAEAHGRGFPSGHAAVVAALLAVAWPALGPRGRIVCSALAAAVVLSRVYVGAYLPLDVVAGAGLGLAAAGATRLALGRSA